MRKPNICIGIQPNTPLILTLQTLPCMGINILNTNNYILYMYFPAQQRRENKQLCTHELFSSVWLLPNMQNLLILCCSDV